MKRRLSVLAACAAVLLALVLVYNAPSLLGGYSYSAVRPAERGTPWPDVRIDQKRTFGDWIVLAGEAGGTEQVWILRSKWGFLYRSEIVSAFSRSPSSPSLRWIWSSFGAADGGLERILFAARTDDPRAARIAVSRESEGGSGASSAHPSVYAEMDIVDGFAAAISDVPPDEAGGFVFRALDADGKAVPLDGAKREAR